MLFRLLSKTFLSTHLYIAVFLLNFISLIQATESMELSQYQDKFSCFNEEYIVHNLWNNIPGINKFYVDIGANDGVGWSNTAHLALSGWSGLAIEGDSALVAKFSQIYRNIKNVRVTQNIVTPVNVCELLNSFGVPQNFGVLSLDIDSYDYFVLEALLEKFRPIIIITEINEKIPPPIEFTVLYEEGWYWDYSHFFGQSICQLEKLCLEKNYCIVALEYNNAILVADEFYHGPSLTAQEAYLQGYQLRNDRKLHFPWNKDMECLLSLTPEASVTFLHQLFRKYSGKYKLELPTTSKFDQ